MTADEWEELEARLRRAHAELQGYTEIAAEMQRRATKEDIPRLVALLDDDSFLIRESAAWPLSDMGVTSALPELLRAARRAEQEGHDNDGLNAALADLAAAHPDDARAVLERVGPDDDLRPIAEWLLEFCGASQ